MQLLKANNGKSRMADLIMNNTKSLCFVYCDYQPYLSKYFYVNSSDYSFEDLKWCINEVTLPVIEESFDYFIVYTNKTENEMSAFVKWLDHNHYRFHCKEILVMCKE